MQAVQKCRKTTCMSFNDYADSDFVRSKLAAAENEGTSSCGLLWLPVELLQCILRFCDTETLSSVNQTCWQLRQFDAGSGLRLVEKIAKASVIAAAGEHAGRWRRRSWLVQLKIEDSGVGFANFAWSPATPEPSSQPYYRFLPPTSPDSFLHIKLEGMGPKLLVSDFSTADQPVLRWRLVVRGNTAVEFGVVPLCLEEEDKALHKCQQEERKFERLSGGSLPDEQRPTGFCSSITVGSLLPFKTAIMKGSIVELLARRGRLEILVQNPPDGQELYWHNTRTVPKPYKGPREVRFEQDFSPDHYVKLALTSWAHGAFDVLHAAPGSRVLGPEYRQAWDRLSRRNSTSDSSSEPATPQSGAPQSVTAAEQSPQQQPQQSQRQDPAAAAAASAGAGASQPAQQQHMPGSPSSDESTSSQDATIL
jgi:hypothetical protein